DLDTVSVDLAGIDLNRRDGIDGDIVSHGYLDIRTSAIGPVGLRDDNIVACHKAHGVAVVNGCGIASAATRAACAAARTAGTTCSARTTRATSGVVGRRRFNIPMHAVERGLQRWVILAVVAEGAVIIERNEVRDRCE